MTLKNNRIAITVALTLLSSALSANKASAQEDTKTVFIDPGHGGHDNGSSHNGYFEDLFNLQISNKVAQKLKQHNIKVLISRTSDTYLSLSQRTRMSNSSGADLFISIHQNASESSSPNGVETFYMGNNEKLAKTIQQNLVQSTSAKDRGYKVANLQVLRDNNLPAVLVECGFISNPEEGDKLYTKHYQEKIADGIVKGILQYLNAKPLASQNTSTYDFNIKTALNKVNVMSSRDNNSRVIGVLPAGTKVEVIDSKFDWLKIKYNGEIGYVSGVYVK